MPEQEETVADVERFLDKLDAILGPVGDPKQDRNGAGRGSVRRRARGGDGAGEEGRAGAVRASRPEGDAKPAGEGRRRRVRRWGDSARRAAQRERAGGDEKPARSLRALREGFPLSQSELAERAHLSRSTIAGLESGKRRAHPVTRRLIASVFKVGVGEILW
jgi:DNA-binding XRE family transcriptional regulator